MKNTPMNHAQQWITRYRKYGAPVDRFWSKVSKGDDCWEWVGGKKEGYGKFWHGGKYIVASRAALMFSTGAVLPNNSYVCHHCDNPACVRPDHLFIGTQFDNMRDCVLKGRNWQTHKTHCPRGHAYSGHNLLLKGSGRVCRECRKISAMAYRKKRKSSTSDRLPLDAVLVA